MCSFPLLEAISLKSRGLPGPVLYRGSRFCSSPLPSFWWLLMVLDLWMIYGLWLHHYTLCLHFHMTFSCSTLCLSYEDTSLDGVTSSQDPLLNLQRQSSSSKKGNIYKYQELDMNIFLKEEIIFLAYDSQH